MITPLEKRLEETSVVNEECLTFENCVGYRGAYDIADLRVRIRVALSINLTSQFHFEGKGAPVAS